MSILKPLKIIVAGGGIGGLSAALALARVGCHVHVLEKAREFGEIGAGIQIGPNGFHALDKLGIGKKIKETSVHVEALNLMDLMDGKKITSISLDSNFVSKFGNPYRVIHRADLLNELLEACQANPNIILLTGHQVTGYVNTPSAVIIRTNLGEEFVGDAAIGCDGLNSRVRAQVTGGDPLRAPGHVTYRAVVAKKDAPVFAKSNSVTLWAGPKCHFVHYPLKGDTQINLVATFNCEGNDVCEPGSDGDKQELMRYFEDSVPQLKQLLETPVSWKKWMLADREPLATWTDGRVTLLGDAAHPTLQYMAQGACMALEDSVCLASALEGSAGDVREAFKCYEAVRIPRSYRVVLQSRLMGDIYHAQGPYRTIRNTMFSDKSNDDHIHSLGWLYKYKVA